LLFEGQRLRPVREVDLLPTASSPTSRSSDLGFNLVLHCIQDWGQLWKGLRDYFHSLWNRQWPGC